MFDAKEMDRRGFLVRAGMAGAGLSWGIGARAGQPPSAGPDPTFGLRFDAGAVTSLRRLGDRFDTDYVRPGHRLGDVIVTHRRAGGEWQTAHTATLKALLILPSAGAAHAVSYRISDSTDVALTLIVRFVVRPDTLLWTVTLQNTSGLPLEIGDLSLPLPMNTVFQEGKPATASVLKHSFVSGDASFLFWMRSNSIGPHLMLTPRGGTHLEYWDTQDGYRVFIHSAAAGETARQHGCRWRQPHTSLFLAPQGQAGDARTYGFQFRWAGDYDAVRQALVDDGLVDVLVVPGMTVPSDLSARFCLRTRHDIWAIQAEFPAETRLEPLGRHGDRHLYQVRFGRLGENRLTVRYGGGRSLHLEFFATEPLETLIKKRAAFIARHQQRDQTKWYRGLLSEWNMDGEVMLSPDDYDRMKGWRIYEVTCDDPGLSKPAFLASKNAEHPVQAEVTALDEYIRHFVWGGLQRTADEAYPYGIYGIPDWKTNRDSADPGDKGRLHLWRVYDYAHIVVMYFHLSRVARQHPQIRTALPAEEYLRRAAGTALALFTVPAEIVKWSAYETGLYNERVIVDLIPALEDAGMADEATRLRGHWERKVKFFVTDQPNLFGSEYPFDPTGFESTHALAKYALQHPIAGVPRAAAERFLTTQIAANIFCRGSIEPAYYLLGSDYRGEAGDSYTLTYMSQMGGWAVLDYGLNFAPDPAPYLRLGYASYLSAWALMNTGTPHSGYGYWYPGLQNDGGAGGGFEPAPYGTTWLGQPHHRGAWYYSSEIDLGYCGALRTAATVLADDPVFGRICYGGDWRHTPRGLEVFPKDGVRRRFHALLHGRRFAIRSDTARFSATAPIVLQEDLDGIRFDLERDHPTSDPATLCVSGLTPGPYTVRRGDRWVADITIPSDREAAVLLPMAAVASPQDFSLTRQTRKKITS